jgi:hypothetical protein
VLTRLGPQPERLKSPLENREVRLRGLHRGPPVAMASSPASRGITDENCHSSVGAMDPALAKIASAPPSE